MGSNTNTDMDQTDWQNLGSTALKRARSSQDGPAGSKIRWCRRNCAKQFRELSRRWRGGLFEHGASNERFLAKVLDATNLAISPKCVYGNNAYSVIGIPALYKHDFLVMSL